VEGTCDECGNEPLGYIKCSEFLDVQKIYCFFKEDFCAWGLFVCLFVCCQVKKLSSSQYFHVNT
jgi:hypothetical protein